METGTEIAKRFGAKVTVSKSGGGDRQLFLIVGSGPDTLAGAVSAMGGEIVLRGPNWLVAGMRYGLAMALRQLPGVQMVGGVTVDPQRWKQLTMPVKSGGNS